MSSTSDAAALRAQLAELATWLHSSEARADPVLWAAASSLEAACLLLDAYGRRESGGTAESRQALLDALGSTRAAVGAATHALQETVGVK